MVGRYVKMTAHPGRGDQLASAMLDVARSLEGTRGCELYAINRGRSEPDVIWVTELWHDQEALDDSLAVLSTEAGRARLGLIMELISGRPERIELVPLGGVGVAGDGPAADG
jgi:quinol monooxygenase YgiN